MTIASQVAAVNKSMALSDAASDFVHYAKAVAATGGKSYAMQQFVETVPTSFRVQQVVKAGVNASMLSNAPALVPYREIATGFFASLGQFSCFARIYNLGDFTRVPLRTSIAVLSSGVVGYSENELAPKPLASGTFATATLEATKTTSLIVLTYELARHASQAAVEMLGTELRRAASVAADAKFLAILAATSGITSAASSGITATAVLADLADALDRITIGSDARLWFVCSPKVFKRISMLQSTGGFLLQNNKIGPVTLAPSDAATTTGFLFDSKQIASELDNVVLDSAREGAVQISDSPGAGAQSLVSLFQANLTAIKAEVHFGCVLMRSAGATMITGYS
jgi:HK97 family phage major capsid protein